MAFTRVRKYLGMTSLALGAIGLSAAAFADSSTFPDRPVRLIVPYAAGGGTDVVMRAIAPGVSKILGQSIIVENRPGGGTSIATDYVSRAEPDGYTLLAIGAPIYLNTALGLDLPYDPLKDLAPLSLLVKNPALLLSSPNSNIADVKQLVALSQEDAGGISYATAGTGSISHLIGEVLQAKIDLNLVHIPYKGSAPALNDLMGDQVPVAIDAMIPSGAQVQAGKVNALAIISKERSPLLPEVPTIEEAGYPAMEYGPTFGIMLPANTPTAIIDTLYAAVKQAIEEPATKQRLLGMGYQVVANTPAEFGEFLKEQIDMWTETVKANNITVE